MAERLVVIGGDAAGMSAASQARRRRDSADLEIVAFEQGRFTSYSACGIPYLLGGLVGDSGDLIARDPETFRSKQRIDVQLRHEAIEIDLDRRAVRVHDHETGRERWEGFDQLMVGTGAIPNRPPLAGVDARGVHGVQTLGDGLAVQDLLASEQPTRAVVVGGGYIGLEMAEALMRRGIDVTLVEAAPQPMGTFDPDMAALVSDALRKTGATVHLEEPVTGFDTEHGHVREVITPQRRLPADLVVLGLGVRPNVSVAAAAGIAVGPAGGITTDRRMRTSADGVWAAGDCVENLHLVSHERVTVPLGTHANKQGRTAGINIGGGYATFPGVVGTAASKICALEVARTGLNESEATRAGFDFQTVVVESTTRAGYYPDTKPMQTKIIAEKRSGRFLGAQIVGEEGAGKRIDVLAVALWNQMTVGEMSGLDLSYAPPFSPVWDPVLIAVRKAAERIEDTLGECR